jgi:catechol 2,3-dioxygenase-like lactoylglutathione lyase family enzyme
MFKSVQRVSYLVRNRDEMVAYMERAFGMRPDKVVDEYRDGTHGMRPGKPGRMLGKGYSREAHYRVGPTLLQITQPVPGSEADQFLEKNGPGIFRLSWGVNNIPGVAQHLKAQGITLREDERGYHPDHSGPNQIDIDFDPEDPDSLGVFFQLMEDAK